MKADSHAQLTSILDFTAHIVASLNRSQDVQSPCPDVLPYINILPLSPADVSKSQKVALRNHATEIWNISNHLTLSDTSANWEDVARLRVFACLLLTSVTANKNKNLSTTSKLFSNVLVAGKACMIAGAFDLAERVLQSEAATAVLAMAETTDIETYHTLPSYLIEYHCLRALLEWKRERLDLTEHWYRRINPLETNLQEREVERIVDLCYEIGRDCLAKSDHEAANNAAMWLDRALAILDQPCSSQFFAASDLRLNVMHSLGVRALAHLSDGVSQMRARTILERLKLEYGVKLPILLLGLEIFREGAAPALDLEAYAGQVQELIRSVHLIAANHRLIMYHIQELQRCSHLHASQCLKSYILHRLLPEEKREWYEQATVSSVVLVASSPSIDHASNLQVLEEDLHSFADAFKHELPPTAARTIHAFIWKMIRETDANNARSLAMSWCQIGLHRIFASAGEAGVGKLERQLISYHLLMSNTGLAQQMLEQMSFLQKNNRLSRYLAYCVAIRAGNDTDAQSCLNTIANGQGENNQLLLACVGESIKYGKPLDTARLALRIVERKMQDSSMNADLGALLKYAAGAFLQLATDKALDDDTKQEVSARLCWIFKHAARLHQPTSTSATGLVRLKIDASWFEKSSFQLASLHIEEWRRNHTIDLLDYCRQLCESQNGTLTEATREETSIRRLHECLFLQAILYAKEARSMSSSYSVEDLPETSYNSQAKPKTSECREVLHKNVFNTFTTLNRRFKEIGTLDAKSSATVKSQLHVLVPWAFEAVLFLNVNSCLTNGTNFDELSVQQFFQTIHELELPVASYAVVADILLAFTAEDGDTHGVRLPRLSAANLFTKIIQELRRAPSYDIEQAARWVRTITQLIFDGLDTILASEGSKVSSTLSQHLEFLNTLIEQADNLVQGQHTQTKQRVTVKKSRSYPVEELQWLATKMWNLAIDLYAGEHHTAAKLWAGKAIQLAEAGSAIEGNTMREMVQRMKQNMKQIGWYV